MGLGLGLFWCKKVETYKSTMIRIRIKVKVRVRVMGRVRVRDRIMACFAQVSNFCTEKIKFDTVHNFGLTHIALN